MTARDVLKFRDDAFLRYYTNPDYLRMTEARFGKATADGLKRMTSVSLKRDLLDEPRLCGQKT